MPFVTQDELETNCCGAMCLCYYHWLLSGTVPTHNGQLQEIQSAYAFVIFGERTVPGIPDDNCDPVLMLSLARLWNPNAQCYVDQTTSGLWGVFQMMQAGKDGAFIRAGLDSHVIQTTVPPVPPQGHYAIAVFNIGGDHTQLHYLLYYRDAAGVLFRYNPWDGVAVQCPNALYDNFEAEGVTLNFENAAILL